MHHPRIQPPPSCQQKQVVVRAVFRRCTAPELLSNAEQPTAVRYKPSLPLVSLLPAPFSDAVPRRTDNCHAMPAAAIRCKQPKPTPMRRPMAAGIILAAATRAQQPPSSHTPAPTAMPHHRRKPSMNNDDTGNVTGRVGSQQTTLVQGGQGFHPENPRNRDGLQDDAPNGENDALGRRRHHRQQECRQGLRPENPIHCTHSA